ncbi:MAG: hypothetical protein CMH65_05105 [Nevskiales bacterium]|uniref:Uncharacterized protein n=1 Tax=Abyssibacter profundi TaxID=2182787 RepID=A0A363UJR5_9GAMM|nr:hypothetical protein [Nevskiales bacterium]PWN55670.1 hypothetical protein DEH80_11225 [Abyssibacter profundi]
MGFEETAGQRLVGIRGRCHNTIKRAHVAAHDNENRGNEPLATSDDLDSITGQFNGHPGA